MSQSNQEDLSLNRLMQSGQSYILTTAGQHIDIISYRDIRPDIVIHFGYHLVA